jgi:tRNA (guanine37-N1)-methyltransferase
MRRIQIVTLFPEMFEAVLNTSMLWKAQKEQAVEFSFINLRDFGLGPRRQVDDTPYGGGDGMLLRIEPLAAALDAAKSSVVSRQSSVKRKRAGSKALETGDERLETKSSRVILMTPRGERFNQAKARELAQIEENLIFVCARYEGYDERIVNLVDQQVSIGDYVLTGGELPAMVVIDSVVRLLPGVLGGEMSAEIESFSDGETLEYPQYTKPREFRGLKVPDVLTSGDHGEVQRWRSAHSQKIKPEH